MLTYSFFSSNCQLASASFSTSATNSATAACSNVVQLLSYFLLVLPQLFSNLS